MKQGILFAAVLFAALAPNALAQAVECKYDGTQQEMNLCADMEYKGADKALNSSYAKLMSVLPDAALKAKLKAAQKSWILFRDNECLFETAGSEGGTIHPLDYSSCLTKLTKERTKTIDALTACQKNAETCQ